MRLPDISTLEGRRAWAFLGIVGGSITMTCFAAIGVWAVWDNAEYSLILALAAHAQILLSLTALGWVLGRRIDISGSRDGVTIEDLPEKEQSNDVQQ